LGGSTQTCKRTLKSREVAPPEDKRRYLIEKGTQRTRKGRAGYTTDEGNPIKLCRHILEEEQRENAKKETEAKKKEVRGKWGKSEVVASAHLEVVEALDDPNGGAAFAPKKKKKETKNRRGT